MVADITDKREMMANQLLMRGHATMLELMTAAYGEWPPKGLDITEDTFSKESISLADKAELVGGNSGGRNLAWAMMDQRSIEADVTYIKKSKSSLTTILAHESTHILQADNRFIKERERGIVGIMIGRIFGRKSGSETSLAKVAMSNALMKSFPTPFEKGGVSHVFRQVAAARSRRPDLVAVHYQNIRYMREGVEIQARMNEIMIDGYQRWGRLPANQTEFYAALKSCGVQLPADISKMLEQLPADAPANKFLTPDAVAPKAPRAAGELNEISMSFPPDERRAFWHAALPGMYADLITMFGDKNAVARMGFENAPFEKAVNRKADQARKETPKK